MKVKNKRVAFKVLILVLIIVAGLIILNSGAIFQRGNPLPYISKMFTLSDTNPYAKVFADKDIYITQNDPDDAALIKHIESAYNVKYYEQMGSCFFFHSDEKTLIANIKVYWEYYIVWDLSFDDADAFVPSNDNTAEQFPH